MIVGFVVLLCILVGCVVAMFGTLILRRRWLLAVPAGIAGTYLAHYLVGLSTRDYQDEFVRLAAMSVVPITLFAWLGARLARRSLTENF